MTIQTLLSTYWPLLAVSAGFVVAFYVHRAETKKDHVSTNQRITSLDKSMVEAVKELKEENKAHRATRESDNHRQEAREQLASAKIDSVKDLVNQVLINVSKEK